MQTHTYNRFYLIRRQSRGAALILVLGVSAIISALAIQIMESANFLTAQQQELKKLQQSYWYAKGGEEYARLISKAYIYETLLGDSELNLTYPLGDNTGNSRLNIELVPLQNCFNLNSFSQRSAVGVSNRVANDLADEKLFEEQLSSESDSDAPKELLSGIQVKRAQLKALLAYFDLDEARSQLFADRLIDWLDEDSLPTGSYGAENIYYTTQRPARLTPNQHLVSEGEMREFLTDDYPDFEVALPLLCVRPGDNSLRLNVNQLDVNTAVLLNVVLMGKIDKETAVRIIENRPEEGYSSIDDFWQQPELINLDLSIKERQAVSVENRYFKVITQVLYQKKRVKLISIIRINDDETVQVLSRKYGVIS